MFFANIQIDDGETLPITGTSGYFAGKSILTFLMSLLNTCDERKEGEKRNTPSWLERFAPRSRGALCAACASLMHATINSYWDYCEGEDYQGYVKRTGDAELGEEAFLRSAAHYKAAWTEIHTLIARVQTVILQLEMASPSPEPDPVCEGALVDFRALHDTLDAVRAHGAKRARIDIH